MSITEEDIKKLVTISRLRNSELGLQRIPLSAEENMRALIREGNYQEIHVSPFPKIRDNMGSMAKDSLTQFSYVAVASITMWSRTAIEGGALPDDVFDLSDTLLFLLSYQKTEEEIYDLYRLAAVMFAKLVHEQKQKTLSWHLEQALAFISRNIYKKIRLEEVASFAGLTPGYLSTLFAKEMGITVHDYIQKEKIGLACNLLMHTDRPVSDIATYMGFATQSNFAVIFKKWKGMTPSEFRNQNHKDVF